MRCPFCHNPIAFKSDMAGMKEAACSNCNLHMKFKSRDVGEEDTYCKTLLEMASRKEVKMKCPFCGDTTAVYSPANITNVTNFDCPTCTLSMSCKDGNLIDKLLGNYPTDVRGMPLKEALEVWKRETMLYSSTTQIIDHSAYHYLVDLGEAAVAGLLEELAAYPWIGIAIVLQEITGVSPEADPDDYGKITKIAEAWLKWGLGEGYYDKEWYEELHQKLEKVLP